ncbi:Sodium/pantothenate symporter [Arsenophonus endosymbiont of Bemisia tabaci Q2]|nr:Sodium/pantothenate symporter [Arsenophonus endosymbiont of Bemisia tabaci Q2]
MHLAGALGRAILLDLTIPDQVIPTLIITVLPPFAAGIFLAAPMAAIMSTINSQLLQSSATIIKDLYLNIAPEEIKKEKKLTWISSASTLILGALLLLAAWHPPQMIIWLNLLAFGGLQAVFLWPLILGLYWQRANRFGALSSMILGALSYTLLTAFDVKFLNFYPIVPALLLSLLAFLIGNVVGEKKSLSTSIKTS